MVGQEFFHQSPKLRDHGGLGVPLLNTRPPGPTHPVTTLLLQQQVRHGLGKAGGIPAGSHSLQKLERL